MFFTTNTVNQKSTYYILTFIVLYLGMSICSNVPLWYFQEGKFNFKCAFTYIPILALCTKDSSRSLKFTRNRNQNITFRGKNVTGKYFKYTG